MTMKMKMKLPDPEPEEEEDDDEEEEEDPRKAAPAMPPPLSELWKEGVYEWFGSVLSSAQRLEFCCGLLDLCHPLELRFLGSCLEDLARKDYHSLRDSEVRANSVADLAGVGDPRDEVTRSKLVVSLALLGSENREAAAVLARALTRGPLPLSERGVQEFLLLLTMASNHPAFSFHQKETLRRQLAELQRRPGSGGRTSQSSGCKDRLARKNYSLGMESNYYERTPPSSCEEAAAIAQRPGAQIENIIFKPLSKKRADIYWEFDVTWTNLSMCTVRKTDQEIHEFLTKLPKELSIDASGKTTLWSSNHSAQTREDRRHFNLESTIRQMFSSPTRAFLKSEYVREFFFGKLSDCSQHHTNLQPALKLSKSLERFKEDSSEASSQEEDGQQLIHQKKNMGKSIGCSGSGTKSQGIGVSLQHSEQNGILDWKKRNYSTKHSTDHCTAVMAHCLSEDKRSTSSGSKKLNTQSDINNKNQVDRGSHRAPVGNGILRIPPVQHVWAMPGKELRDVGSGLEACGDSSSESYSSPSSPRHDGKESCESEDEKDKDSDSTSEDSGKDKHQERPSCNLARGSTSRPTAQVAPVQSENCTPGNPPIPFLPRIPLMPPMPYVMQNGGKKPDCIAPVDKTVGMIVTVPPAAASLRESSHVAPLGAAEAGKRVDMIPSHLSVATPFLLQTANSALHPMTHRHKMTASQMNFENCHVPGPQTPAGTVNIGSANTAFIPVHSHSPSGKLSTSSVLDPTTKTSQNIVGLNALLPQADGNIGTVPESASLKVMLPAAGLLPPPGSYNLSGTPNSVLPLQGSATPPSPVGQIQSTGSSVPTHTPGPVPSLNTALTHSTAQSDSTSYINTIGNTSTNGTIQPNQQLGCGACSSCGCRGSCGTNSNPHLNYYYPSTIPSHLIRVPFIPFSGVTSLCNGSYLNQAHQNNGTQIPFYQNPYTSGLMHDPMANQTNYGMQQMPGFFRGFPLMYQVANMVTSVNGMGPKKNGNASCYNCGVGGHYAQDCKQPSMEASQPGAFKLKFAPSHDLDSAD